jgi:hypothetical protein
MALGRRRPDLPQDLGNGPADRYVVIAEGADYADHAGEHSPLARGLGGTGAATMITQNPELRRRKSHDHVTSWGKRRGFDHYHQ